MDASRGRGSYRGSGPPVSKNRRWIAGQESVGVEYERWERGGHRKTYGGRGAYLNRAAQNLTVPNLTVVDEVVNGVDDEAMSDVEGVEEEQQELPVTASAEEREAFVQRLMKAREAERSKAIAEGKMDSGEARRLSDAITMVGTCVDMCPRFERYWREKTNSLDPLEMVPGFKLVDHKKAVKKYERGSGDKSIPSDLRPPKVLKRTLDYLFCDIIKEVGFHRAHAFVRDRSRQVRSDFTIQAVTTGKIAIECHGRCARFHILSLHLERKTPNFNLVLEEQQLMNTLLTLSQLYDDSRDTYVAPNELEFRVYHRLMKMRDQSTRDEHIPEEIENHPVFKLTTNFRARVQEASAPITRASKLKLDAECMQHFATLAAFLRERGHTVMMYLIACVLEHLFGDDTIDDMESIRGDMTPVDLIKDYPDINFFPSTLPVSHPDPGTAPVFQPPTTPQASNLNPPSVAPTQNGHSQFSVNPSPSSILGPPASEPFQPPARSAFSNLTSKPNVFGSGSVFGSTTFGMKSSTAKPPISVISSFSPQSVFSQSTPPRQGTPTRSLADSPPLGDKPAQDLSSVIQQSRSTPGPSNIPKDPSPARRIFTDIPQPSPSTSWALETSAPAFTPTPPVLPRSVNLLSQPPTSQKDDRSVLPPLPPQEPLMSLSPSIFPSHTSQHNNINTDSSNRLPKIVERKQTLWDLPSTPSKGLVLQTTSLTPPANNATVTPSPKEPPQLHRIANVSLPPTPTLRWFEPNSQSQGDSLSARRKSILSLQLAGPTPSEILSPLQLPSPGFSRTSPVSFSPSPQGRTSQPTASTSRVSLEQAPATIISPVNATGVPKATPSELNELASSFARRSLVVKDALHLWLRKATSRAAWADAVRRGDEYKNEVQQSRLRESPSDSPSLKRQQAPDPAASHVRNKRSRRRSSGYKAPITDEDLVKRLKENQEENQRRWAQGSFLQVVKTVVKSSTETGHTSQEWSIWLSMNTENDSTAIWLQHKFDVPTSGVWVSESTFSMPLNPDHPSPQSEGQGLIVFECTPLGGLDDPIEKKYRVLDDCARLRDVLQELSDPTYQHYHPNLVFVVWDDGADAFDLVEFESMISQVVEEGLLQSSRKFRISATEKDLDARFSAILTGLPLITGNKLAFPWNELVYSFCEPLRNLAGDWLDSCWTGDEFDWARYGDVSRAIRAAQAEAIVSIFRVVGASPEKPLPEIEIDFESLPRSGLEYALDTFLNKYIKSIVEAAGAVFGSSRKDHYYLPRDRLPQAVYDFEVYLQSLNGRLREQAATAAMVAPKKRREKADGERNYSGTSPSAKRCKLSSQSSANGDILVDETNTELSPPPSTQVSTIALGDTLQKSVVTVAMLRALAQNVLKSK